MPVPAFPPFPQDVPTFPCLVIDYELIKAGDTSEIDRLWEAGTKLGFWYLKNHGVLEEVNRMFDMGAETMALPVEEKMKFEQGDSGMSFGYKALGANAVDASGKKDSVEFINVAKDDAMAWPKQARRAYPSTVNDRMNSTIAPFIRKSVEINNTILDVFNDKLGLPPGALSKRHLMEEYSDSESRITRTPPCPSEKGQLLGSHTDLGSLSFLHNRLGGLQVLVPGTEIWQYVKPIPSHAICNVGDTMALFSGGILRSNPHRVVAPPGAQADLERWSLVFFTRPGNSVALHALVDESPMISEAVARTPGKIFETGLTSEEWFAGKVRNTRLNNRKTQNLDGKPWNRSESRSLPATTRK